MTLIEIDGLPIDSMVGLTMAMLNNQMVIVFNYFFLSQTGWWVKQFNYIININKQSLYHDEKSVVFVDKFPNLTGQGFGVFSVIAERWDAWDFQIQVEPRSMLPGRSSCQGFSPVYRIPFFGRLVSFIGLPWTEECATATAAPKCCKMSFRFFQYYKCMLEYPIYHLELDKYPHFSPLWGPQTWTDPMPSRASPVSNGRFTAVWGRLDWWSKGQKTKHNWRKLSAMAAMAAMACGMNPGATVIIL
jgi:hypothetical protein